MRVPVSKFRKEIFSLTEAALNGATIEYVHKGIIFKVTPEKAVDKLANLTALEVVNPDYDLESADRTLRKEMQEEWERDWREI